MTKQNTYRLRTVVCTLSAVLLVVALLAVTFAKTFTGQANAVASTFLNFQARLMTDAGATVPDGNYHVEFKLYTAETGGSPVWTETYTGGDRLRVANGYLTANLGSETAFGSTIDWTQKHWLTMNIGGKDVTADWDGEMDPRLLLTAVPHAFVADTARGVASMNTTGNSNSSNNVVIQSGNTNGTSSNSGNITIDAGSIGGTGTAGTISLGATNASSLLLGRAGFDTKIVGTATVQGGTLSVGGASQQGILTFYDNDSGSETVSLQGGAIASSYNLILPTAVGTTDQCLKTDSVTANQLVFGTCAAGGADNVSVNGTATSDANFINTAASGTATPVTISVNATPNPDEISITIGNASDTQAGSVTTGTQTFAGVKTFNDNIVLAAGDSLILTGDTSLPGSPTDGQLFHHTSNNQLYIYTNGKWQADRTDAILVAASDSSDEAKRIADYVADGNGGGAGDGDQVQINSALSDANPAGSGRKLGKVFLFPGTYVADATITIPNNTTLSGAGEATVIELADLDATDNLIENSDTSTGTGVVIRDLKIDGRDDLNTAGTQYGILLNGMGDDSTSRPGAIITNIWVEDFRNSGIRLTSTSDFNTITEVVTYSNLRGIDVIGHYNTISGNTMISDTNQGYYAQGDFNTVTANLVKGGDTGIYLDGSTNSTVSGNTVDATTSYGVIVGGGSHNSSAIGNIIKNTDTGIRLGSSNNAVISSNTLDTIVTIGIRVDTVNYSVISSNTIKDSGGATLNNGIYLTASDYNTIINNTITDSSCTTSCYAINVNTITSDDNYLADNRFTITAGTDQATILDVGTNTRYASQMTPAQVLQSGSSTLKANATIELTGDIDTAASTTVPGSGTKFLTELQVGDRITVGTETKTVTAIASDTSLTVDTAFTDQANDTTPERLPAALIVKNASNTNILVVKDNGDVELTGGLLRVGSGGTNSTATAAGDLYIQDALEVDGAVTLGDATSDDIIINGYLASHLLPKTDDTYDLGDNTHRFRDLYLGGETLHIGTSTSDEGAISYNTSTNTLNLQSTGTIGFASDVTIAANKDLTVSAGGTFTNAGATVFAAATEIEDLPTGGVIGTAAATVDVATTFNIDQDTAGQTLTLPNPTDATAGRIVYINSVGSASFTIYGVATAPNNSSGFIWNGSIWTAISGGGSGGSGVNTIGTFSSSTSYANGAQISGNTLTFGAADGTNPGLVSTSTQTFAGAKTFTGLIQGDLGLTVSGATVSLNGSSNFATNINTGTSTGAVSIGNSAAGAIALQSGTSITLTGNTSINTSGSGTTTIGNTSGGAISVLGASTVGILNGTTGTGLTVGNTTSNPNISFVGSGTFSTGTGAITVNGDTTVAAGKYLRVVGGTTTTRNGLTGTEGMVFYDTDTDELLTYANGKWQADRTDAILVAASNSTQAAKDAADYVADGNGGGAGDGDQVQINAALTAASGKKVILLAGTYVADATILIPNNTTLSGVGRGTIIELADLDATDNLIENSDATTGTGIVISDLKLDGRDDLNTAGTQYGIYFNNMGGSSGATARSGGQVINIWAEDFKTSAIYINNSNNNIITGNNLSSNYSGIDLSNSSFNNIVANTVQGSGYSGIVLLSSPSNTLTSNTIDGNSIGINIGSTSEYTTISNNSILNSTNEGLIISSNQITAIGNTIKTSGSNGIYVNNYDNSIISSNQIYDSGGASSNGGIWIRNADYNQVTNNYILDSSCTSSCTAIIVEGDHSYLADNTYRTTAGTDQATIYDNGTGTRYASQITPAAVLQSGSSTIKANATVTAISGTGAITGATNTTLTGTSTKFSTELQIGDRITVNSQTRTITAIGNDTSLTVDTAFTGGPWSGQTISRLPASFKVTNASGVSQFLVQDNGNVQVTGNTTFNGTLLQKSDSASALLLQDSTGTHSNLSFDASTNRLRVYNADNSGDANSNYYIEMYFDDTSSTGIIASSTGTTQIGSGTGNIAFTLAGAADVLTGTKTTTLSAAYGGLNDFTFTRNITAGSNTLNGNVFKIEDLSTASGTFSSNLLYLNQQNVTTGNLILAQTGGSTDRFKVDMSGNVTASGGLTVTGAVNINSTGSGATTIGNTSGGTVAVTGTTNINTTGSSTTTVGNSSAPVVLGGNTSVSNGRSFTVGTGSVLTNNSASLFTAISIGNTACNGSLGASAAATVDVATTFNVTQTTASCTLNLYSPTDTTAGRMVYINNTSGSVAFTLYGINIAANTSAAFMWNGSAWKAIGDGGVTTVGTFSSSTSYANGASISGSTITLGAADGTTPGILNGTTQTIGGNKTYTGDMMQTSDSATAFLLKNSTGAHNNLLFDSSVNKLRVYNSDNSGGNMNAYVEMYYDDTADAGVIASSSGVLQLGTGAGTGGNINMFLSTVNDQLVVRKAQGAGDPIDLTAAYSGSDFVFTRNFETDGYAAGGKVFTIEDISTLNGGSISPTLLYINQNNAGASGYLIQGQTGGSTNQFLVDTSGNVDINGVYKVDGTSGDSDTCSGGQILLNQVTLGGITTAGSCSSYSLQGVYSLGNSITTNSGSDILFTLSNSLTDSNFQVDIVSGSDSVFKVTNANTTTPLSVSSSSVTIGAQANDAGHNFTSSTYRLNSAAGTFGSQTARDAVTASVVYRGKLFVSVKEPDAAGIYRYDGGNTWTLVTNAVGKAVAGDATTVIDQYVMAIWNDTLYIGSQTGNAGNVGAIYASTTADTTADSFVMVNSARGNLGMSQTGVDGIYDMTVWNGKLFVSTLEANLVEVGRYDGGTTFTQINSADGRFTTIASVTVDGVNFTVFGGRLFMGTYTSYAASTTSAARVVVYDGVGTTTIELNGATAGTIGAETVVDDISGMAVWNGSLYVATGEANAANIYIWDASSGTTGTAATNFRKVNNASGKIIAGDTANIDSIMLRNYRGRLYAGTYNATEGTSALYEYNAVPGDWTLINGTRGTFVTTTEATIDGITMMQEMNGILYIGTEEANKGAVYSYTKADDQSYALRMEGPTGNYGSIRFIGTEQAIENAGRQGTFNFSHGVTLSSGAFDYAEDYPTLDSTLLPGEPVAADPAHRDHVKRAEKGDTVLGVVSENPGFRISSDAIPESGASWIPIALVGRVPVIVTTYEGASPIVAGDTLALSDTSGVLEKLSPTSGAVVGTALDNLSTGTGKVSMYVQPGIKEDPTLELDKWFAAMNDYKGVDVAFELAEDGRFVLKNPEGEEVIAFDSEGNAKFAGTITADKIAANSIEGLDLIISRMVVREESNMTGSSTNVLAASSTEAETAVAASEGELTLDNGPGVSILTLADIETQGGLIVNKDARFNGKSTFMAIAEFYGAVTFKDAVNFEQSPTLSGDNGGKAIVKKDANKVTITFEKEYTSVPIVSAVFLTEDTKDEDGLVTDSSEAKQQRYIDGGYTYFVSNVTTKGFTIILNKKAGEDLNFNWLATAIGNVRISESTIEQINGTN